MIQKIDFDVVKNEVESKNLTMRKHPSENIFIINYTHRVQFEKKWNEYTKSCRGIICDSEGKIISRPFDKFFNLNEIEETKEKNLPKETPKVFEKLDGSLGISYFINDKIFIATRGTFDSEMAIEANKILESKKIPSCKFDKSKTYLFEIIYPENRIVVSYDYRDIILLAVRDTRTGEYLDYIREAKKLGLNYAKEYNIDFNLETLKKFISKKKAHEFEGFVFAYSNGLRVKIKSLNYVLFHKTVNGLTDELIVKRVYETVVAGRMDDLKTILINDPILEKVIALEKSFNMQYKNLINDATNIYNKIKNMETRKEQAVYIFANHKEISSLLFAMLDNRDDIDKICWKLISKEIETMRG